MHAMKNSSSEKVATIEDNIIWKSGYAKKVAL